MKILQQELCRLARRLAASEVRLFLVGGYALLLKANVIRENELETVAPTSFPRATDDLDLLLTARLVADVGKMGRIRDTLEEFGYEPVEGGKFYQWERPIEGDSPLSRIRLDLLGQLPRDQSNMKISERRMRPRSFRGLHAHPVEEAAFIHEDSLTVEVCTDGPPGLIEIPHPFSFLLLKLFAFDDRKEDPEMDKGRHHAFDLYRIVAMTTPEEWMEVPELCERHADSEVVRRARRLVVELFSDRDQLGVLRLREHIRRSEIDVSAYPVEDFLSDLEELMLAG